jgi:haloalkane dehalogenase
MVTPRQIPTWLAREYPFAPRVFSTPGGARMSYLDEGPRSDEAVLMLHGNPTWSFYYRHAVRLLAGTLRCVVPDHIGMGLSEKPQHYAYTLETRIGDIEALVNSLGLKRVHLIVHDWGGAIGFGFATRHPGMVGRIAVLNTAAFLPKTVPARIALCRTRFPGTMIVRGLNGFAWPATRMAMNRSKLTVAERRGLLFPYGSWADRVAVDAFVKDIPTHAGHPSHGTLARIGENLPRLADHPLVLIWGGADFCFDDRIFARWAELFPRAVKHHFKDAGHYVLEDARSEVLALLRDFLPPVEQR